MNGTHKYELLLKYIKDNIDSGLFMPGEKILSEPEISKKFNISRNTIRQALKELEIAGYLRRVQGKGTFVEARKVNVSKKIALLLYDLNYMTHPFTGEMIKGIGEYLEKNGYSLEIQATSCDEDLLASPRYAGFIFGAYQLEREFVAEVISKNIPFVFAKNYLPGLKINAVLLNYERAGFLLADHLLSLGHERIALLAAGKVPISEDFTNGIGAALAATGRALDKKDIFNIGFSLDNCDFMEKLSTYSSIMTMDDNVAIELIKELKKHGKKVPENISVTGCNDHGNASLFTPGITTVRLPIRELGMKAAEKLLAIIKGQRDQENITLEPELVIRKSTGPVNL